ncbi:MAG: Maf family protein [Andreesenia angusta]|nr:Maf family protein [Andreesenia angusta]
MMDIVLASKSERRIELLSKYDIKLSIMPSDIEEVFGFESKAEINAMTLAFEKAWDIAKKVNKKSIIIGADTVVYKDKILGKPLDRDDGFNMLKNLSKSEHYVITGFSIINRENNIKLVDYEKSIVRFRELSDNMINNYLDKGEYRDKAGAYAIQGIGEILCESFEGSYSNIVGLPISKLDQKLKELFKRGLL